MTSPDRITPSTQRRLKKYHSDLCKIIITLVLMACSTAPPPGSPPPQTLPSSQKKSVPPPADTPLIRITPEEYPVFSDSFNFDNLELSIANSLAYLKGRPPNRLVYFGKDPYPMSHLIRSLTHFLKKVRQKPSPSELNQYIVDHFQVYRSQGKRGGGQVLFTGYYEPFLSGSLVKSDLYRYPVYSRPKDLINIDLSKFSRSLAGKRINGRFDGQTLVPYYSRRQIETDPNFHTKAKPIAWVDNRVDLFFLHIQGSGRIYLKNDKAINVHYHGVNGRPYRSIGKLLIDQGKIDSKEMSMQKIRQYLQDHPEELDSILHYNTSYVFFKTEEKGPLGYLGVPLTPARSAAFDRTAFPPAALAFVSTQIPTVDGNTEIVSWIDHKGFVLNQDTGGAIKGAGRADLFWGSGPYAEIAAGHLKHQGELFFLILKPQSL